MKKKWRITYDSDREDTFLVHTHSGIVKFKANKDGLYLYRPTKNYRDSMKNEKTSSHKMQNNHEVDNMVSTVAENHLSYTQKQFKHAKEACKLYHTIGMPTVANFKVLLHTNFIKNCPVTVKDVTIAEKIFGPSVSRLKGKSTQRKPNVVTTDVIDIPRELIEKNRKVELCMDTMFINKEGMLTMIDKSIKFRSLIPIANKTHDEYYKALDNIFRHYNKAGFVISRIHCNGEYHGMMDKVSDDLEANMNYANAHDHVPEVE